MSMDYISLKNIAKITMGQSPESSSYNENGDGLPFYQGNADFGELYPEERVWCNAPKKIAEPMDILISVRAPIGALNYAKDKCCIGRGLAAITVEDEAERNYIYHLLKARNADLNKQGTGSTFKAIGRSTLEELKVPQITQAEKQRCMNLMDFTESVIRKRKQQLADFDQLIKARFVEMFGNKGENPKGFEVDKLGNLYKFQYGKGNNIPEDKGDYPCYGSNGQVGHHTEYNSEDAPIIGHIGAYAGIVNWGAGKHYVTYNGVICKLKTERINPVYGFYLLQQQDFNRVATKGGGQPFVSYGDLESPVVVVPPIEVQKEYARFAEQVDKSKVVVQKALDASQVLFDSLMQKYFG